MKMAEASDRGLQQQTLPFFEGETPRDVHLQPQRVPMHTAIHRQLELLNRVPMQQPQNEPANFGHNSAPFGGQQNLGSLPFQPSMFSRRQADGCSTVVQGQQQFPAFANGLLSGQPFPNEFVQQILRHGDGGLLTLDEFRFKILQLKRTIETEKANLAGFPNPTSPEADMALREKHRELQQKEIICNSMADHLRIHTTRHDLYQPQQSGASNVNDGQAQATSNPAVYHQSVPNWLSTNQSHLNQQMLNTGAKIGHTHAPHQHISSLFHPNLDQSQLQQPLIPHSGPTHQQQHMLQQFVHQNGSHPSPSSSGSATLSGRAIMAQQVSALDENDVQHRPSGIKFPTLSRERFFPMIQEWWKRNNIKPDPRLMISLANRQIDIQLLYTEVLQYGGVGNVKRHDLWNVIATKMGWTAANISETGRTQDQIAKLIRIAYEQLLETFELTYTAAAMKQYVIAPLPQQATEQQDQSGVPSEPVELTSQAAKTDSLRRLLVKLRHLNLTGQVTYDSASMKGHGAYSDVFVGRTARGVTVAVKRIRAHLTGDYKLAKVLAKEIHVWSKLNHPNVLPLMGYMLESDYPVLVSRWIDNGTIMNYLRSDPDCDIMNLALGIAKGLEYLHDIGIVHSDLKSENVLMEHPGEPLICDFGISHVLVSSQTFHVSTSHQDGVKGTTRWMARELLSYDDEAPHDETPQHTKETDIWAYGMTLYEIISKHIPFVHLRFDPQVFMAIFKGELPRRPASLDNASEILWKLCGECWSSNPQSRPTAASIVKRLSPGLA